MGIVLTLAKLSMALGTIATVIGGALKFFGTSRIRGRINRIGLLLENSPESSRKDLEELHRHAVRELYAVEIATTDSNERIAPLGWWLAATTITQMPLGMIIYERFMGEDPSRSDGVLWTISGVVISSLLGIAWCATYDEVTTRRMALLAEIPRRSFNKRKRRPLGKLRSALTGAALGAMLASAGMFAGACIATLSGYDGKKGGQLEATGATVATFVLSAYSFLLSALTLATVRDGRPETPLTSRVIDWLFNSGVTPDAPGVTESGRTTSEQKPTQEEYPPAP